MFALVWIQPSLKGQWLIPNGKESNAYVLVSIPPHLSVSGDPGTSQAKFLGLHPLPGYCLQGHMPKEGKTNAQMKTHTHKWHMNKDTILPHHRHGIRDPGQGCGFCAWVPGCILQVSLLYLTPCWSLPWKERVYAWEEIWKKKKILLCQKKNNF